VGQAIRVYLARVFGRTACHLAMENVEELVGCIIELAPSLHGIVIDVKQPATEGMGGLGLNFNFTQTINQ
jgi:hypothetical protein